MLESAEKYSDVFKRLHDIDHDYKAYFQNEAEDDGDEGRTKKKKKKNRVLGAPEEDDWENARCFIEFLKIFFNVTKKISGSKYCLGVIYGADTPKYVEVLDEVKKTLNELFTHFKMKVDNQNDGNTTFFSTPNGSEVDLEDGFDKYMEENVDDEGTKVDIYCRDKTEKKIKGDNTFDVLNWWKLNSGRFPVLSQVAKHVLGMPISTVASESAFSTGGRVIDKYRSSLTPKTAEALICTQDWSRSNPADLQNMPVCGQLEDMVESLENLEIDILSSGKASCNDYSMDEDSD